MKKDMLLGHACVAFDVTQKLAFHKKLDIMEYSGRNQDYGRSQGNGRFKVVKEHDMVHETLSQGKGVYFNGIVYFLEELVESSEEFRSFQKAYERSINKIEKKCESNVDLFLLSNLAHPYQVPIVKSIIGLYDNGFLSRDKFLEKLAVYMPEVKMAFLIELLVKEKAVA